MSDSNDPVRWTAHPDDAPDALRAPLEAAGREAPSEQQMKTLALRLAALGVGTAAAASAATAKAAAGTAVGAKTAGALTMTKVLASLAVAGAVGVGAVMMRDAPQRAPAPAAEPSAVADVAPRAEPPSIAPAPTREAAQPSSTTAVEPSRTEVEVSRTEGEPPRARVEPVATDEEPRDTPARSRQVAARQRTAKRERAHQPAKHRLGVKVVAPAESIPGEVELLRQARAALASRPREAYALTEEHRQHYARGTFVQERDALAIEALLRTGELDMARDLARRFVRDYPSSPHAHRFREKMGL
jgi:hypothetical protein